MPVYVIDAKQMMENQSAASWWIFGAIGIALFAVAAYVLIKNNKN